MNNIEVLEQLRELRDKLNYNTASLVNLKTLPDRIHVEALRENLPRIVAELDTIIDIVVNSRLK